MQLLRTVANTVKSGHTFNKFAFWRGKNLRNWAAIFLTLFETCTVHWFSIDVQLQVIHYLKTNDNKMKKKRKERRKNK